MRRKTIWEAGASQHHRDSVEDPAETPRTSQYDDINGFEGGPQLGPKYADNRKLLGRLMNTIPVTRRIELHKSDHAMILLILTHVKIQ